MSCTENKYIQSFMAMCLRYMQSFQFHFVPGLRSYRKLILSDPCTTFHFHFMQTPQHRTASVVPSFPFRRLH